MLRKTGLLNLLTLGKSAYSILVVEILSDRVCRQGQHGVAIQHAVVQLRNMIRVGHGVMRVIQNLGNRIPRFIMQRVGVPKWQSAVPEATRPGLRTGGRSGRVHDAVMDMAPVPVIGSPVAK